jgi:hypothetical protein
VLVEDPGLEEGLVDGDVPGEELPVELGVVEAPGEELLPVVELPCESGISTGNGRVRAGVMPAPDRGRVRASVVGLLVVWPPPPWPVELPGPVGAVGGTDWPDAPVDD